MNPQRFLEEIARAPADDAPRLVYADWLTAQGDPRGEFISLQCALASQPPSPPSNAIGFRVKKPNDIKREALRRRHDQLLGANRPSWSAGADVSFVRGFIEGLRASAGWVLEHGRTLFEVEPFATQVHLAGVQGRLAQVATIAPLQKLTALGLEEVTAADLAVLGQVDLPCLEALELRYLPGGEPRELAGRLLELECVHQLKRLTVIAMRVDLAFVEALIATRPRALEALDLESNAAPADALERLSASSLVEQLRSLKLGGNGSLEAALPRLVERPLPKLRELGLAVSDALHCARVLVERRAHLPALTKLDLQRQLEGDRIPPGRQQLLTDLRQSFGEGLLV